ncbi:MAG: bile acid:sodium symporter family protein [Bacteroidia bacterium]|nr:bile acid:sodium symporter family protein [Bacteroidia bacterium]
MPSSKRSVYTYFYFAAILFSIAFLVLTFQASHSQAGWALLLFFLSLAIAFRGSKVLKGFIFTAMILAAVSFAMYHPSYFQTIGDFKTTALIIPAMQVIMFGMGTELSLKDFADVLRMPKAVLVGIVCHYTIMPLVGFTIASIFNFPSEIAAGIILVGSCPSGLASNVMCFLAKANLALSVTVTAVSTLVAPLFTPLLMKLLAGKFIEIHFLDMVLDITKIVIIPIVAGLVFHYIVRGKFKWLDKAMPYFSMIGIGLVLVVITADKSEALKQIGLLLLLATAIHNLGGFFLGYWSARLMKFPEKDSRTIALEVGMQNAGLAAGLAKAMGVMLAGLAPAVFGVLMNLTGSVLANWWHNRDPDSPKAEERKE